MEFIDNTGHIFSLPSYEDQPINLEYVEGDYIFWLKDSAVSINNYYIKPVRFLLDEKIIKDSFNEETNEIFFTLEITNSSQFYKLISPKYFQSQLEKSDSISKPIGLDKSQFVNKLTLDDFYFDLDGANSEEDTINLVVSSGTTENKFYMFPFYVVGYSEIEGTLLNNITIKYSYGKDKIETVSKTLSKEEYYDHIIKQAISPIKIYQWDLVNEQYTNKRLVLTINPAYRLKTIESNTINNGLNKYEILYNGDGIDDPNNVISDNIYSSLFDENEENKLNNKDRIRSTISNGELALGQLPVEEYIYIYKLDHILPQGYYTFEGEILKSISYLPRTILPLPYMGFNHDGYRNGGDLDSLYPEDQNKSDILQKFQCGTLEILNTDAKTNKGNYLDWKEDTLEYKGYQISDEEHLDPNNTPIEYPPIRDFWFMFISKEINEGKNGKYIDNYVQSVLYKSYQYTPITVGCSFIDECEELIINGKNMGIRLPKEVLKAIYNSPFESKNADEKLLKNKLKELLLNYMNIKGETGNFKSMTNSLKWFGWANHISISQLIKTDNEFQNQFILDYFDIHNDIKETFKYFNKTNNISLTVLGNKEIGENYQQNYSNVFIGEGKPKLEDLFAKNVEVVKDDITFYKPYYNFVFNELALKLDCLKYYYQQYFLPVHININRASISHKVYANTTKLAVVGFQSIIDKPFYMPSISDNIRVIFPDTNRLIFKQDNHIIDDKFNEFSNYNESNPVDLYYVNENCVTIPITLTYENYEYILDPNGLYLYLDDEYVKINYFYVDNGFKKELTDDHSTAVYYSFEKFVNIKPLSGLKRYTRYSSLYSKDDKGDYFMDHDGNYVKMNYFYKMISETSGKLSDRFEATHFSLVKNEDIQNLNDYKNNRYVKISEYYFNCKLILTATTINQDPLGHYIKLNDKYIYKEKFYKSNLLEVNDEGNYIQYYGNYLRIDPNDRYDIQTIYLLDDNNFNFYQCGDQYYKNFVLIPRLLNNFIDYEKAYFRLSLMVNDKWFNYDFKIVTPNVYLDLGKLEYKYKITNGDSVYYPFRQLKSLSPLKFNSFIYEPDLITINTLFKGKDQEDNNKLLTFLDKLLETDDGTHDPDQYKMYEFYKKYYSNVIRVPYNTKYYNRIHVFDIYVKEWGGIDHIIKLEDYSLSIGQSWEEWSPYNGGQNNIIKGWRNYLGDIVEEYPNSTIRFYRDNVPLEPININNLLIHYHMVYEGIEYDLPELNNSEGSINKFDIINLDNNNIIDTLCRYDGVAFQYLYNKGYPATPTYQIDHSYVNLYWYSINQINTTQTTPLKNNGKIQYDPNADYTSLYQTFFNNTLSYKYQLNESVVYDYYLMHDDKEWYMVAISQYPIASYPEADLLNIHDKEHTIDGYHVVYADYSIDKFLVNRMVIKKANGYNQFNKDDLIIVGVNNNDYQFNIDLNNKWTVSRIYDINSAYDVNSNTNLTIITNDNIDNLYTPGFYNVKLQYTINGLNNILHNAIAQYKVLDKYQDIKYPEIIEPIVEEETFDIRDTISDFIILYENDNGERHKSKDILDPSLGWTPIGIKILNQGYFGPEQKYSIYIGLKMLSTVKDNNGEFKFGNSGNQQSGSVPYFGFFGIDIPTLKNYPKICLKPEGNLQNTITMVYPQTDYHNNSNSYPSNYSDETLAGQFKWPAPNNRGWYYDPESQNGKYYIINLLNDDDTFNSSLIDEDSAVSDWNGWENTMNIIKAFGEEYSIMDENGNIDEHNIENWFYTSGSNAGNIKNGTSYTNGNNGIDYTTQRFSPMVACAYKYKTKSTNCGDWYIPAFAEVFFLSYNFKRLTDLFSQIAEKYQNDCKIDLLTSLGSNALWTTTEYNQSQMWEIHPSEHAHPLSKTTSWRSFPYIRIEE